MKAMVLKRIGPLQEGEARLEPAELPVPEPADHELLVRVTACGVCHTELDEIEGRTPPPVLPVIPGHQIVGRVERTGRHTTLFKTGDRVGIGWIYSSCGSCAFCQSGNDNLCAQFAATGRDVNGGYAQFMAVPESSAHAVPNVFSDVEAAPLLCAGAIGYRSLRLTGLSDGQSLGLTGFGASAHLVLQMARHRFPFSPCFVFARSESEREFARHLGAVWAGDTDEPPPQKLDAIIDTTPAWKPVVAALGNLKPAGRLVINAIRKEERDKNCLLELDYSRHLWLEKEIKSVANVSRADISECLRLAAEIPLKPEIQEFTLEEANKALAELKARKIRGAKVLRIDQTA
ncbi:MAG: zinc-dependent alcohol dehydrogenase family protein [Proteobacteria bacterium]|nr:zinc-dependent alcohol dehydrogenase family protein [Pseudomonadota bacterium]MBU4295982.1 zinc-dependent alcohol dehydrogenase family protein [Pseudomonadota bacterium]MCG2747986.1 zinc-dependent alcohol dehydrogenase family protein [Desulfobulbaceae bacterium]